MNIGIIGCGWVAEKHVSFIKKIANATIVGIVDENKTARERISTKYELDCKLFTKNEIFSSSDVDVVHILTPPFSHRELALEAIKHGKHVYIEKPLALNFDEVSDIYDASAEYNVKVCPGYNYLFDPIVSKAIKIVESPGFGKVVYVESYYGMNMRRYDRLKTNSDNEIHWSYNLPGGFHQNYITHPLYMCLRFTGKVKDLHVVSNAIGAIPQNLTDEIRVLIKGEKAIGTVVQSYSCEPYQHFMIIYGEKQAVKIDWRNISLIRYRKHRLPDAINRILINNLDIGFQHNWESVSNIFDFATKRAIPYHGMKNLIEQFYECIEKGTESPISKNLVYNTEKTSDRIYNEIPNKRLDFTSRNISSKSRKNRQTVLVTGASGFVGKEVVRKLLQENYNVRAFVRKLSYIEELEDMGVEIRFGDIRHYPSFLEAAKGTDIIIHLAAALGVPASDYMEITVGGVKNLIRIVAEADIKRVIYMSSMSVFDVTDCRPDIPIKENHIYERRPLERGAYTASKLEAEKLVKEELSNGKVGWTILRPSMIIGKNTDVFLKPIGIALGSRLRLVFGMGFDKLRLIPVEDVIDAMLLCVESDKSIGQIYNLNHNDRISKREYLKQVLSRVKGKGLNLYLPHSIMKGMIYVQEKIFGLIRRNPPLTIYRYETSQKNVLFDSSKLGNELGWKPNLSLRDYFYETFVKLNK